MNEEDSRAEKLERRRAWEAAKHHAFYDPTEPTWAYRLKDGKVEGKIFAADAIPEGWYDSPANIPKEPVGVVAETDGRKITPKRRGRPRKVDNGDS